MWLNKAVTSSVGVFSKVAYSLVLCESHLLLPLLLPHFLPSPGREEGPAKVPQGKLGSLLSFRELPLPVLEHYAARGKPSHLDAKCWPVSLRVQAWESGLLKRRLLVRGAVGVHGTRKLCDPLADKTFDLIPWRSNI